MKYVKVAKQPCPECGKRVQNQATHFSIIHGPAELKRFGCEICEKRFVHKDKLVAHRSTHSEIKPFGCKFNCGYFAKEKGNAEKHARSKNACKKYNSERSDEEKVNEMIKDTETLEHFVCDISLKINICQFCWSPMRYELIEEHIVTIHMDINSTQNSHTCKICNKMLASNEALMVHIALHQNKTEHRCQFPPCRVIMKSKLFMKIHEKICHEINHQF